MEYEHNCFLFHANEPLGEPHRNRFTVLLSRTAHLAYHLGQAALAKEKA